MTFDQYNALWLNKHFEAVNDIQQALEHKFTDEYSQQIQEFVRFIFTDIFDSGYVFNDYSLSISAINMANTIDRINAAYHDDDEICFVEFGEKYLPKVFFVYGEDFKENILNKLKNNTTSSHYTVEGIDWNMYHAITDIHNDCTRFVTSYKHVKNCIDVRMEEYSKQREFLINGRR